MSQLSKSDRDKLIMDNTKLVHYVIQHKLGFQRSSPDYDDIYSIGLVGLVESAKNYDPEKSKFSTYASSRIIIYLLNNYIRPYNRNIKISIEVSKIDKNLHIKDTQSKDGKIEIYRSDIIKLYNDHPELFTSDQLMKSLGVSRNTSMTIMSLINSELSLEEPISSDDSDLSIGDAIADKSNEDLLDSNLDELLDEIIQYLIDNYTSTKFQIKQTNIYIDYLLDRVWSEEYGYDSRKTQKEYGSKYSCNQTYVSRVINKYNNIVKEYLEGVN